MKAARIDEPLLAISKTTLLAIPTDTAVSPQEFFESNVLLRQNLEKEIETKYSVIEEAAIELIDRFVDTFDVESVANEKYFWMDPSKILKTSSSALNLAISDEIGKIYLVFLLKFLPNFDNLIKFEFHFVFFCFCFPFTKHARHFLIICHLNDMYYSMLILVAFRPVEKVTEEDLTQFKNDCMDMFAFFFQRSIDALVRATKSSLEVLRRRAFAFTVVTEEESNLIKPFLYTNMILQIPSISISPSLDEVQFYCGKVVSNILEIHKGIIQWGQRSHKLTAVLEETTAPEGTIGYCLTK